MFKLDAANILGISKKIEKGFIVPPVRELNIYCYYNIICVY